MKSVRKSVTGPSPSHAPQQTSGFHRLLKAWYRRHRRALPWRDTRDPYPIWLSETMLQQTQVATVLPYYRRFLEQFPSLHALAEAPEERVLAAWAGLGYYSRARRLHAAARLIVAEHGGSVPGVPETFAALPGVGRYTLGAVQSIAFGRRLPVVDGNVARVLSRWFRLPVSVREPAGAGTLWDLATRILPMRGVGDWNQALMELGATVCLPRSPRCEVCPVVAMCEARRRGDIDAFPRVTPRRSTETHRRAVALVTRRGRMLVIRRSGPLLAGLWEPPSVEDGAGVDVARALAAELRRLGVRARLGPDGRVLRHRITHREIVVRVWTASEVRVTPRGPSEQRWIDPHAPSVGLTALGRRAARLLPRARAVRA